MRSRSILIVMSLVCSSTIVSYADEVTAPASVGNGKGSTIIQFDLNDAAQLRRQATVAGPRLPLLTRQPARRSVGSALSPHAGIGKGVSVDLTYDDAQYTHGQGRYISHWFNGDYGAGAEVSIHFGYGDLADTTPGSANQMTAYNVYDAITGLWPRTQDIGCDLQTSDTLGYGSMPSLDLMANGRVVMGAMSHFHNGFLGNNAAYVDNMFFCQSSEFGCTYAPGINTTFIDSTVYREKFLSQTDGNYSRDPQVATQWDGSNTIVHVLLMESLGTVISGSSDYVEGMEYYTCTYYRKVGAAASGVWSDSKIIDSLWFPWPSMAAAPYPHQGVAVSYTNPSYYGALLNNAEDLEPWYRESLDRGLTWGEAQPVIYYTNAIAGDPMHFAAWLESQALYTDDGDLHIVWTAKKTSDDPYFDGFNWTSLDQNIYHWAKSTNDMSKVADADFEDWIDYICGNFAANVCGFGGSNAAYIANINLGQCDDKIYCVWNQIHERAVGYDWLCNEPDGYMDDCSYTGNRLANANWEIMMSVARLSSSSFWDLPRNVSNTYTPNCGLPGDPSADGLCGSEYKPALEKYGFDETGLSLTWPTEARVDMSPGQDYSGNSYLSLQYIDDQFPGPSMWGRTNPPATLNSLKWIRLACVDPVEGSAISVEPSILVWPQWVQLGQIETVWITVYNEGNISLDITEIGLDDNGGGWLSASENPTPGSPFQVEPGQDWWSSASFQINIDASTISTTTWLDGEVWLKSNALNTDSLSIPIHVLAAPEVEPVEWDTVMTHVNMFDLYFYPEGACVALTVSNFGEIGWGSGTSGRVNLDYVESELECGDRAADAIYLNSGSAFVITADDGSGANASLTCSYNDVSQSQETGWDPVGDKGSITGGRTAGGEYDSVYTGKFVNRDTTIAMERTFYAPRSTDPANQTINFVICRTKIYSGDGAAHNHVTIGNVIDWNVPSEQVTINTSDLSYYFVYMRGTDTSGVLSCQSNTNRFATEAFVGAYTSAEWEMDNCANNYDYHGAKSMSQSLLQDTSHYRDGTPLIPAQPNPKVWWDELATPGLIADAGESDQAIWMTYGHDINLAANDTLYFITVLTTVRDGVLADLEAQVSYARQWYYSNIVACCAACCQGRVGDVNGSGWDEPTIGDISALIDAKFITGNCVGSNPMNPIIPCLQEADINLSGGMDLTCDDITIGDISILIDYLFISGPDEVTLPDCGC